MINRFAADDQSGPELNPTEAGIKNHVEKSIPTEGKVCRSVRW